MRGIYGIAGAGVLSACLAGWVALASAQPPVPGTLPHSDGPPPAARGLGGPMPAGSAAPEQAGPPGPPPAVPGVMQAQAVDLNGSGPIGPPATLPGPGVVPGPRPTEGAGAPGDGPLGRQEPAVSLEWIGAPTVKVGQASDYSLVVRNTCNIPVQQVVVRVRVPAGMSVAATEPRTSADSGTMAWELGTLLAKQERNIQLRLIAATKGDLAPQAWVTFTGSAAIRIQVREPKLLLKATCPDKVLVGDPAAFTLAVSNPGDGSADQVKIHAVLSEGLEHARGNRIHFEIGNLAAGETRNVTLLCATRTGGVQKCEATAEAEGGLKAADAVSVNVIMPRLDLLVTGPGLRYLGRKALYALKVTNPGDAAATNVTVADNVPAGFKVLAASDGGRHDFQTRTVSWFLGEIGPGQTREVKLEVEAINPGEHRHKATAVGARGLRAEHEMVTRVEGLSALLVELVDTDDPIEVNGDTAYEVRITNTGSKTETDIKLIATIPDKMQYKNATGMTSAHEEGRQVVFAPLAKLAPRADAIYRINVKAIEAGTVYFKIQLTSTNLTEPVIKNEATRIYSDSPVDTPAPTPAGPPASMPGRPGPG